MNLKAANVAEATPKRLTDNEAVEVNLQWSPDSRHLFFQINRGSVDKKYEDPQPRLYWVDAGDASDKSEVERWFASFPGRGGAIHADCRMGRCCAHAVLGTEHAASIRKPVRRLRWEAQGMGWRLRNSRLAAPQFKARLAFAYSAIERPN